MIGYSEVIYVDEKLIIGSQNVVVVDMWSLITIKIIENITLKWLLFFADGHYSWVVVNSYLRLQLNEWIQTC